MSHVIGITLTMFLARARINSLKLEEAIGRGKTNYDKSCKLCHQEEEDLVHFTVKCPVLEKLRNYDLIDKRIQDPKDRMIELLFKQNRYQEVGHMLRKLWNKREGILRLNKGDRNNNVVMNDAASSTSNEPGPDEDSYTPIERGNSTPTASGG